MRKAVALALVAAMVAVVGTIGLARPQARAPVLSREYPAITTAEALEAVEHLAAEKRHGALERLLGELRDGTTPARARAAAAMAKLGPDAAPAIPDLVAFLTDADDRWARVRGEIEDVLVAIGEAAVPAALDLIGRSKTDSRQSGIRVLARIRGEAAVETLAALLRDAAVGKCAAYWLAKRGEPGRAALLAAVADPSIPLRLIADAVADAGKPMALPVAALLSAADLTTRERAARMIEKLGKNARPAMDAILRALADPGFGDRLSLVETLKFLDGVPPGMAVILADLAFSLVSTEAGADVRRIRGMGQGYISHFAAERNRELAPLRALAELGPAARGALPTLLEILASGDPDAVAAAARAYWRIGGDPGVAVEHLTASLAALPKGGYHPALSVLIEMGSDAVAAIPALLREMESGSITRAHPAAGALAAMGETGVTAVREWLPTGQPELSGVVMFVFGDTLREDLIARHGDEARDFFAMLETPVTAVLTTVAVGDTSDPLAELRRKIKDPGDSDREATFRAVRSMEERAAPLVPDLVVLLADDDLRADVASTLGAIGPAADAAVPALERYVADPWYPSRSAAVDALWRITGETRYRDMVFCPADLTVDDHWAVPRLLRELGKGSASWRRACVEALGRLGEAARPAAPDLARIAADESEDEYLRDAAREALASIGR